MDFASLIAGQREYFLTQATRPLEFRRARLRQLYSEIENHEARVLEALHADLRKPAQEAYATEIGFVLADIRHTLKYLPSWMRPQRRRLPMLAWPGKARVVAEPYGVALILGPWNYPFQLLLSPLVGAVAAGNCVVLKPSELAPHTAAVIAGLIAKTCPPGHVTVVEGDRQAAEGLLNEKFDKIFFTGSTSVGRAVMSAAARHLTPVTLELGGKCPAIVCADAPLDVTARRIAWGKFLNAGQTCVSPDFVLVDQRVRDLLVKSLKRVLREFYGDDPQRSSDYGRIVNRQHFDRVMRHAADAKHDAADRYIAPTILTEVSWDAPVMGEEIFGPVLPILSFNNLDEILARLRDRPTPLALYLFTNDRATQERIVTGVRSGGVCINDTVVHITGRDLPFGGLGESGMGRYHGKAGFECFSHQRTIVRRATALDAGFRYPPMRLSLGKFRRVYKYLSGDWQWRSFFIRARTL